VGKNGLRTSLESPQSWSGLPRAHLESPRTKHRKTLATYPETQQLLVETMGPHSVGSRQRFLPKVAQYLVA